MTLEDATEFSPAAALKGCKGKLEPATVEECVCRGWRKTLGQRQADIQKCSAD